MVILVKAIAIDGPAGAGKSTIARAVAQAMGYIYVDTGALYRAIGLGVCLLGLDPHNEKDVTDALDSITVTLRFVEGEQRVFLNGHDVSGEIRQPQISMAASQVASIGAVREFLFSLQKDMAKKNNVVMDGRDIGTVVLPQADVKIFLTASPEERAQRRYDELMLKGEKTTYEEVLADVKQRDYNDTHRDISPLRQAQDAILVDTTGITLEQSIQKVHDTAVQKLSTRASC